MEENRIEKESISGADKDLLDQLKEFKETHVPKEEYEKVLAERNRLVNDFMTSTEIEQDDEPVVIDLDEQNRELFNPSKPITNMEFAKRFLEYRKNVIAMKGYDPIIPKNANQNDYFNRDQLIDAWEYCLEKCHDDPNLFDSLISKILVIK